MQLAIYALCYTNKLITFLLMTQGMIKSVIISMVANSIDNIAGNPNNTGAILHHPSFDTSVAKETITAEGICDKK